MTSLTERSAGHQRINNSTLTGRRIQASKMTVGAWMARGSLTLVILVYVLPVLYLILTSLKSTAEFNRNPLGIPQSIEWSNFSNAWKQGSFAIFALNSLLYSIVGALIGTVASLLLAFPVARRYIRWSGHFQLFFVVALFLPNALVGQFQLLLKLGLYDNRIGYMLLLISGLGVGPLLLVGYLKSIPESMDEAAAMDGCSYWKYLWRFVVPLSRSALVTVFILQAIGMWNEIIVATVVLSDPTKSPVSKGLYAFSGPYGTNVPLLASATMIVAGPLILIYIVLQRYIIAGALGGSFKG